ncbi:MAG: hypothetical protein JF924_09655 [Candidatus Dormibacteraeota bacterium]|nr:hypothetical protein [Candidatus Dormibacteraeota bacterium]
MQTAPVQPAVVGVMPAQALASRARLFSALERAHGVRFVATEPDSMEDLDAAIAFPPAQPASRGPLPLLIYSGRHPGPEQTATVVFGDGDGLDGRLRGQRLAERQTSVLTGRTLAAGEQLLASCGGSPAWVRQGPLQEVAGAPDELEPGEPLRSRVRAGRFLEVLALVHFLRQLPSVQPWDQPPLRASLVFDDPNLRSRVYGHIDYQELAVHARRHGYHAAVASIPLDYRSIDPGAAALFRENPAQLSLAIHGNNHERMELLRTGDYEAARSLGAQALRRTARIESRFGLQVSRVMCAPHEVCSDVMMRAMFRLGFEALTIEPLLSYPPEQSWGAGLDGFECARIGGGGLPVIPRYPLSADLDDLTLRAFLNLPLVVYGHHADVKDGLDAVLPVVDRINGLGRVSWLSLSRIARSSHLAWRKGSQLRVRMHSLLAQVPVPDGVERLLVELPHLGSVPADELELRFDGRAVPIEMGGDRSAHAVLPLATGAGTARLEVASAGAERYQDVAPPARRIWPVLRRATTEARDRVAPLRHRITG